MVLGGLKWSAMRQEDGGGYCLDETGAEVAEFRDVVFNYIPEDSTIDGAVCMCDDFPKGNRNNTIRGFGGFTSGVGTKKIGVLNAVFLADFGDGFSDSFYCEHKLMSLFMLLIIP